MNTDMNNHLPVPTRLDASQLSAMQDDTPRTGRRGALSRPATCWAKFVLGLLCGIGVSASSAAAAKEIVFGGYKWTVRSGQGGPGPNAWDEQNVWLDAATNLHLKISHRDGKWSCAEVTLQRRLGFGRYEFRTTGRLDRFDDNVVLGLFNYPTRDVGPDATHEIDIEFARWGEARNPMGNFTVWPVEAGLKQVTHSFPFVLGGNDATHRFVWSRREVRFQMLEGHRDDDQHELARWNYRPAEPARHLSQQPMPVHINLWLFRGRPPKDGHEVEVVIRDFKFIPAEE